uniref:Putative membrane protein insertion efficiency factor n=1 Tax=candidate division WWE3 bacterium TaxID=2053526 RepID=A0A832DUH6_UNCKA
MKQAILFLIRFYQKTFSPDHGIWGRVFIGRTCRFEPTCSDYTYRAVEKYGAWRGLGLGLQRVLRCHPWAKGGLDPVR